jgi:hypothetical protein
MRRGFITFAAIVVAALAWAGTALAGPGHGHKTKHHVFLRSARENAEFTKVTFPLYRGTSGGKAVWFIVTEASSHPVAEALGVNWAPKLANTAGGHGSMLATLTRHGIDFPATVDFSPNRYLSIGDYGQCAAVPFLPFGPTCFAPGAVGNAGYSPLIELPGGIVLNAPQVANSTGKSDKATIHGDHTVTWDETEGRAFGHVVYYVSTDVSVPPGAVLENSTFAPELQQTPSDHATENARHSSARAGIIAFTNGQTGLTNPNRQGLNSTILDGPAFGSGSGFTTKSPPVPLNILQFIPDKKVDKHFPLYSPLWDVHFATWQVSLAQRLRQSSFTDVQALAARGLVTNPAGGPFGPAGPAVANCPIVLIDE